MPLEPLHFAAPGYAVLLPLLAVAAWRWPWLRLTRPLRCLWLAGLVLVLMQPHVRLRRSGLDLWVLVDRSASAGDEIARRLPEWQQILERSRGADDRIRYLSFAAEAAPREDLEGSGFDGDTGQTRTALALRYALSAMDSARASRILVLTDGYSTEPLVGLAERLTAQQVALDYRLLPGALEADFSVADLRIPDQISRAEPFLIEVELSGTTDADVPYELLRDGRVLQRSVAPIRRGTARLRFTDRLEVSGAHGYQVRLLPERDAREGNDAARRFVDVAGGPRILCVTPYGDDPLAAALAAAGFEVEVVSPSTAPGEGRLAGVRAVILNNVSAASLGDAFLRALDFFVREQGGGLLMAGGRQSFGSGGYFESAIDALLPVSMELREEDRKLVVAMAIVLDRSGSMGMTVGQGAGSATKMELAAAGAARAIGLLGERDLVTVYAVDSEPHEVVGLMQVGRFRSDIERRVRRIASEGGGIFVYEGLSAAWETLQEAEYGQRHIILFADAADAEEPGDYPALLEEMVKASATVSVIGLGTPADVDAAILQDIAALGNGRALFAEDPAALPALFAQETVAVARSAFIDEPVEIADIAGLGEIAARAIPWPAGVDGFNLSYARPGATVAAQTADDDAAPLVAFWRRGVGRVAAVSFPLAGEDSERARAWPRYADFVATFGSWLIGDVAPKGVDLRTRVDGDTLTIELALDEAADAAAGATAPRLVLGSSRRDDVVELVWERQGPGRYLARTVLPQDGIVRGAVQTPLGTLAFGPRNAVRSAEWSTDSTRIRELSDVAAASGGIERLVLESIWSAPRRPERADVSIPLLAMLLALLLIELLVERVGLRLAWWRKPADAGTSAPALYGAPRARGGVFARGWRALRAAALRATRRGAEADAAAAAGAVPPDASPPDRTDAAARRRERYARAKRGR
jgi:hypothetical protein